MSLEAVYNETRQILYGQGLGEKPAIRLAAADAEESISNPTISFKLASGEGGKVKAGNVLSVYSPDDPASAHVIYVTGVSTDTVTGINGGLLGAPLVDDDDLDGAVLEQNALITGHEIHAAIQTILDRHLYPEVWNRTLETVNSPDLVDGQEAVDPAVMEILSAYQRIGPSNISIPFQRHPETVATALSSSGRMAEFGWIDSSTGYFIAKRKFTVATITSDIVRLLATGAAAIALGGTVVEATIQNTKKDNADAVAQRNQVGGTLWRDFLTLKQEMSREIGRDNENRVVIERG